MFHGALHLCNYKDKTPKEVSLMRRKEDFYLKKYVPREITGR
jgi:ssRNA-specific RNase YbeY (16S rRNA maturation enzyme)